MGDNDFKLCHGVLLASDKKPFGHCWIEKGGSILDFSNGKKIATTKKKYYELGGIQFQDIKIIFTHTCRKQRKWLKQDIGGLGIPNHRDRYEDTRICKTLGRTKRDW